MELGEFFGLLERIEAKMSDFYGVMAKTMADDPVATKVFEDMQREELNHRDVVKIAWKLASKNKYDINKTVIDGFAAQFNKSLDDIKILIANGTNYTLEEALRMSIKLESSICDRHRTMVLDKIDPKLAEFVNKLGTSDEKHVNKLSKFAESRGMGNLIRAIEPKR